MKIINITSLITPIIVGRMSDGSDRQVLEITTWQVEVEQDGRVFALTFDHEPTEQEITDALEQGQGQEVVTVEIVSQRLASTRADLLNTLEATAFLYEQNLQLQEENLMALEGIATLYEMLIGGV